MCSVVPVSIVVSNIVVMGTVTTSFLEFVSVVARIVVMSVVAISFLVCASVVARIIVASRVVCGSCSPRMELSLSHQPSELL